jgi:hypothetical protein
MREGWCGMSTKSEPDTTPCELCQHPEEDHDVLQQGGPWAYACRLCGCHVPSAIHDEWWDDFADRWGIDKEEYRALFTGAGKTEPAAESEAATEGS